MNEDKLKGKNHSFSIFSQLQELYGKYSILEGKGDSNGERIIRKTTREQNGRNQIVTT